MIVLSYHRGYQVSIRKNLLYFWDAFGRLF
nr:MAG TPA: hypothetical protein [Caudoviricetes sp.]DAS09502.1 MAG TPA: hypothetical protein [Caudoviricetes sp.]